MSTTLARVLTVDDRPETAKILARILEVSGFEPHVATSGAEALEIYAAARPHVVLLDLGMPDMDGFEVCRRIRQSPDSAAVLIVIVSGYDQEEQKVKAIEAGANYYLVKPVDAANLVTLIEQHVTEG
jgi:two-component system, cell cycle response regulator